MKDGEHIQSAEKAQSGGHYDVDGNPLPSGFDENGGYYDENKLYYDGDGNVHPPYGFQFDFDKDGSVFLAPVTENAALLPESKQLPACEDLGFIEEEYDKEGNLVVPPGYTLHLDENGNPYVVAKGDQQQLPDGKDQSVKCRQWNEDEQVAFYCSQQQLRGSAEGHHASLANKNNVVDKLSLQLQDAALASNSKAKKAHTNSLFSIIDRNEPWKAPPYVGKKLQQTERDALRKKYEKDLQTLGPNCLRIVEESLGIKKIPKPRILRYVGVTYIATPGRDAYIYPYLLRKRYPGYVKEIEEIEGSFDPALQTSNPPIHPFKRSVKRYPAPYVGFKRPRKHHKRNMKKCVHAAKHNHH